MALQLTYYRTYRKPCATYESASTRQFLHGRTETIRSCSKESLEFASTFDSDISVTKKIELLREAAAKHVKYAVGATNARGVDRHLMGLRLMMKEGEKAEIFEDAAFKKSMNFKLSTSNVSPGDYYYGGFGPVTTGNDQGLQYCDHVDGYGVNYAIGKEKLKFSISSRRQSADTCSSSFRTLLRESLQNLMQLFESKKQ